MLDPEAHLKLAINEGSLAAGFQMRKVKNLLRIDVAGNSFGLAGVADGLSSEGQVDPSIRCLGSLVIIVDL